MIRQIKIKREEINLDISFSNMSQCYKSTGYWDYSPIPCHVKGLPASSWIRTDNMTDQLIYQISDHGGEPREEHVIAKSKYISSPQYAAGQIVFSMWLSKDTWGLFSTVNLDKSGKVEIKRINKFTGKVDFIRVGLGHSSNWIVYEARDGVHTQIFAAYCQDDIWISDIPVTDGSFNAYDPHIAVETNGTVVVAYCAFFKGNYNIIVQKLEQNGNLAGSQIRVSDQKGMCFWPSICTKKEGGIWICWSSFTRDIEFESSYLQHYIYAARRRLFTNHAEIYAGVFLNDQLYFIVTGKEKGYIEPLLVKGSTTAKQPVIVELEDNRIMIIHRFYGNENYRGKAPGIAFTQLADNIWTSPEMIEDTALHEGLPGIMLQGDEIILTYSSDKRITKNRKNGEYFDETNSINLVRCTIKKVENNNNSDINLKKHYVSPVTFPSVEEEDYQVLPKDIRPDGKTLIWGQTHSHTDISICQRMNDQNSDINYRFNQDVQKSLFGGIADHDYNMWPLEHWIINKKADYYYFPGKFIAFPAYEWTGHASNWEGGPFGHVNPVFLEEEGHLEIYNASDPEGAGNTLHKIWENYKGKRIVTIPHQTASTLTYNWDHYSSEMTPIVEIFQDCRGEQEQEGVFGSMPYIKVENQGAWVLDACKRGYLLGFIGGGDHSGTARGGAEVSDLTRSALYDAFACRRTYASTGAGADIVFICNGNPMGSSLKCDIAKFDFYINTNSNIKEIKIVKSGKDIKSIKGSIKSIQYRWETKPSSDTEFWYIRVLLENGEVFWTSPIWICR